MLVINDPIGQTHNPATDVRTFLIKLFQGILLSRYKLIVQTSHRSNVITYDI